MLIHMSVYCHKLVLFADISTYFWFVSLQNSIFVDKPLSFDCMYLLCGVTRLLINKDSQASGGSTLTISFDWTYLTAWTDIDEVNRITSTYEIEIYPANGGYI